MSELNNIVLEIIGNGKGILAADESTGTMTDFYLGKYFLLRKE